MSPDRQLTREELERLISESTTGQPFNALDAIMEEKTKPTLHDLCITELLSIAHAHKRLILQLGRQLASVEARLKTRERRRT